MARAGSLRSSIVSILATGLLISNRIQPGVAQLYTTSNGAVYILPPGAPGPQPSSETVDSPSTSSYDYWWPFPPNTQVANPSPTDNSPITSSQDPNVPTLPPMSQTSSSFAVFPTVTFPAASIQPLNSPSNGTSILLPTNSSDAANAIASSSTTKPIITITAMTSSLPKNTSNPTPHGFKLIYLTPVFAIIGLITGATVGSMIYRVYLRRQLARQYQGSPSLASREWERYGSPRALDRAGAEPLLGYTDGGLKFGNGSTPVLPRRLGGAGGARVLEGGAMYDKYAKLWEEKDGENEEDEEEGRKGAFAHIGGIFQARERRRDDEQCRVAPQRNDVDAAETSVPLNHTLHGSSPRALAASSASGSPNANIPASLNVAGSSRPWHDRLPSMNATFAAAIPASSTADALAKYNRPTNTTSHSHSTKPTPKPEPNARSPTSLFSGYSTPNSIQPAPALLNVPPEEAKNMTHSTIRGIIAGGLDRFGLAVGLWKKPETLDDSTFTVERKQLSRPQPYLRGNSTHDPTRPMQPVNYQGDAFGIGKGETTTEEGFTPTPKHFYSQQSRSGVSPSEKSVVSKEWNPTKGRWQAKYRYPPQFGWGTPTPTPGSGSVSGVGAGTHGHRLGGRGWHRHDEEREDAAADFDDLPMGRDGERPMERTALLSPVIGALRAGNYPSTNAADGGDVGVNDTSVRRASGNQVRPEGASTVSNRRAPRAAFFQHAYDAADGGGLPNSTSGRIVSGTGTTGKAGAGVSGLGVGAGYPSGTMESRYRKVIHEYRDADPMIPVADTTGETGDAAVPARVRDATDGVPIVKLEEESADYGMAMPIRLTPASNAAPRPVHKGDGFSGGNSDDEYQDLMHDTHLDHQTNSPHHLGTSSLSPKPHQPHKKASSSKLRLKARPLALSPSISSPLSPDPAHMTRITATLGADAIGVSESASRLPLSLSMGSVDNNDGRDVAGGGKPTLRLLNHRVTNLLHTGEPEVAFARTGINEDPSADGLRAGKNTGERETQEKMRTKNLLAGEHGSDSSSPFTPVPLPDLPPTEPIRSAPNTSLAKTPVPVSLERTNSATHKERLQRLKPPAADITDTPAPVLRLNTGSITSSMMPSAFHNKPLHPTRAREMAGAVEAVLGRAHEGKDLRDRVKEKMGRQESGELQGQRRTRSRPKSAEENALWDAERERMVREKAQARRSLDSTDMVRNHGEPRAGPRSGPDSERWSSASAEENRLGGRQRGMSVIQRAQEIDRIEQLELEAVRRGDIKRGKRKSMERG